MRFELPSQVLLVHQMTIPIRWGDMDAMGHVNNTVYFRYMESVRLDWIFACGAEHDLSQEGPVIINAFCNFLRQLTFPGDAVVKMYVAKPGRSSFETYHTIERTDEPGVVYAEGGAKTVWSHYGRKQSVALPDWFRPFLMG